MYKALYVVVAIAALVLGTFVFKSLNTLPLPENALYYETSREVKPFTFIDHKAQLFTNQNLEGKWSWVFLGYMSCPDVCPTTLQELNYIYDDLIAVNRDTQILFISADPHRDTVANLANYIAYFNDEFFALRAEHDVLFPFTRNLGLMYAINEGESLSYFVDHSASMILINPEGEISAIFKPKQVVGEVAAIDGPLMIKDFAKIVALYNASNH